jgi:hypothetical protein
MMKGSYPGIQRPPMPHAAATSVVGHHFPCRSRTPATSPTPRWSSGVTTPAFAMGERTSILCVDRTGERERVTCMWIGETVGLGGSREGREYPHLHVAGGPLPFFALACANR